MLQLSNLGYSLRNIFHSKIRARALRESLSLEPLEPRTLLSAAYTLAFTANTLPAQTITGIAATGTVKLSLTNVGDAAPLSSDKVDIHIYARPDGENDVLGDKEVGKLLGQSTNFKVNTSKPLSVSLSVPLTVAAGSYNLIAIATRPVVAGVPGAEVTEVQGASLTVNPQIIDLTAQVLSVKLPATATSGTATTATATIKVTNVGNVAIPKLALGALNANAINDSTDASYFLLGQTNVAIAGMKPGATFTKTVTFTFPIAIPTGTYHIQGFIAHNPDFTENAGAPNSSDFLGSTINITQGVIDLTTSITPSTFPSTFIKGFTPVFKVTANIINAGTVNLDVGNQANIQLVARPFGENGNAEDIPLALTKFSVPISKLAPGKSVGTSFTVDLTDFNPLNYNLVAIVTDQTLNQDNNPGNDDVAGPHPIDVVDPFVDLQAIAVTTTLPATVAGLKSGTVSVTVHNAGNNPAKGYSVEVFATSSGTISNSSISIGKTTSAGGTIAVGASPKISVNILTPGPVIAKDYILVARVEPITQQDSDSSNNDIQVATFHVLPIVDDHILGDVIPSAIAFTQVGPVSDDGESTGTGGNAIGVGGNNLTTPYSNIVVLQENLLKTSLLNFTFVGNISHGITLTYTNMIAPVSLDGLTLVFSNSSVGAIGKFTTTADANWDLSKTVTGFFRFA